MILYANRILGNYTANISGLSDDFYNKIIQYEFDIFFGNKNETAKNEIFWVLSNILTDYKKAGFIICNNEPFINQAIYKYKNSVELKEIHQLTYFFYSLICKCDINNFIMLQGKGLLDLVLKNAKITFKGSKELIIFFQFIEQCLFIGNSSSGNFGGKNIIKNKCDELGLKELLEKYENTNNGNLYSIIERIKNDYYKEVDIDFYC